MELIRKLEKQAESGNRYHEAKRQGKTGRSLGAFKGGTTRRGKAVAQTLEAMKQAKKAKASPRVEEAKELTSQAIQEVRTEEQTSTNVKSEGVAVVAYGVATTSKIQGPQSEGFKSFQNSKDGKDCEAVKGLASNNQKQSEEGQEFPNFEDAQRLAKMREGATRARVEKLERVRAEAIAKLKAIKEIARKEGRKHIAKELEEEAEAVASLTFEELESPRISLAASKLEPTSSLIFTGQPISSGRGQSKRGKAVTQGLESIKTQKEAPRCTGWNALGMIEPIRYKATKKATKAIRKIKEVAHSFKIERPEDIDKLGPEFTQELERWTHWKSLGIVEPVRRKRIRKQTAKAIG